MIAKIQPIPGAIEPVGLDAAEVSALLGASRPLKTLQPGYDANRRRIKSERYAALCHLASVVRENIGRKVRRGLIPSESTRRLDQIRDALAALDRIKKNEQEPAKETQDADQ